MSAPFLDRAASLVHLGQLDDAEAVCVGATLTDPADPQGWMALAEVRGLKNDAAGTVTALRGACRAAPADPDVLTACGGTALGMGRTLDGVRWLRAALRRNSTHLPAMRDLATIVRILAERPQPVRPPLAPPGGDTMVSAIICSPDGERSARAVAHWHTLLAGRPGEVIAIVGPSSLSAGYTEGLARARGEVVVLSHDDVTLPADAVHRMVAHLRTVDVLGLAGTTRLSGPGWVSSGWPYLRGQVVHVLPDGAGCSVSVYHPHHGLMGGVQALDGLLIAARREVAAAVGFDARTFDGFHLYDVDFSFRAHLGGYRVAVAGDIPVLHASTGSFDAAWAEAADAFAAKFAGRLAAPIARTDTYLQVDFGEPAPALRFCRALARLSPAPPG
ncbi:glycosyltransferase [Azospirillum sp. sgz301742]